MDIEKLKEEITKMKTKEEKDYKEPYQTDAELSWHLGRSDVLDDVLRLISPNTP